VFIEIDDALKPSEIRPLLPWAPIARCAVGSAWGPKLAFDMATVEDVTEALRDVIDPELGLDFVELGLIYDVEVEGGTVRITYTLTSPGCPIGPQVSEQIEEFVGELEGVEEVQPTMTFSPPWTPERMSEDAKFALGF
jgi:metal-sulfur cluster biosynthetic enzyme